MSARTRLVVSARTHTGLVRQENQDCILLDGWVSARDGASDHEQELSAHTPYVAAVFDGMGGHAGGAVASRVAAASLGGGTWPSLEPDGVAQRVTAAASAVQFVSTRVSELQGLGTTVAGVAITADRYVVFNVGDSSVLRCAAGSVGLLSHPDRADDARGGTVLTQSLSVYSPTPSVHVESFPVLRPVRLVLCTDGLSDLLTTDDVRRLVEGPLADPATTRTVAEQLVAAALDAGGDDNV
ncbi:MAG: PP2C family protein-serine/threonine phosphatase, partial [Actinomycetes bacterium]